MSIRKFFIINILLKLTSAQNNVCLNWLDYLTIDFNENCYYDPDIFAQTPDIIRNHKKDLETFEITTEDGYILTMFRLPKLNPKGVVLLQHPVTSDGIIWVSQGNSSLDAGYDVWIPNHRGTFFSTKHVNLTIRNPKYWDYSFHEIGLYDISAEIKFIKEKTRRSDIVFIGHSMAVTSSLVYTSLRPDEAASSLKLNIGLSPVAYVKYVKTPLKLITPYETLIKPDIMRNHKRDFETYDVTTEDGYILTMFRLPKKDNPKGVVLLQHPLTTDAIVWVSQGNSSLAFLMSDAGYDVWMANHRGTFFSAKHVNLSVDDPKFWDYSFHEIGLYDISAEVKFIKEKTNRSDIIFIGHSMAVTASLIYTSLRPDEAASSLKINIAMSPAAYSKHVTSPLKFVAPFMPFIEVMNNIFGYYYLFRYKDFLSLFGKICIFSPLKFLCTAPYWFAFGFTPNEYDPSLVNHAFSLNPRAVAWKIIYHYAQNVNADGIFQMYDYGGAQNLYLYEKEAPPEYPLQNIRVPFYAILGDADTTCTLEDAEMLTNKLPQQVTRYGHHIAPGMNHIDFQYGRHRKEYIYDNMFALLEKIQ